MQAMPQQAAPSHPKQLHTKRANARSDTKQAHRQHEAKRVHGQFPWAAVRSAGADGKKKDPCLSEASLGSFPVRAEHRNEPCAQRRAPPSGRLFCLLFWARPKKEVGCRVEIPTRPHAVNQDPPTPT